MKNIMGYSSDGPGDIEATENFKMILTRKITHQCEAMLLSERKRASISRCTRQARYKLSNVCYCAEHASLRLLNEAKLNDKIEELK